MLNTEYSAEEDIRVGGDEDLELSAFAGGASLPLLSTGRAPGTAQADPCWFRLSSA